MAKLLHYEFRKSRSALLALLVCTAVGGGHAPFGNRPSAAGNLSPQR